MKIHALKINIIIFGYDISKHMPDQDDAKNILARDQNDSIILNEYQEKIQPLLSENEEVFKFINKIKNF